MNNSSIKDSTDLYLDDDEYGDYPESSLWWDEDYDPPDYSLYIPNNTDYNFDWGKEISQCLTTIQ
jgi:hypothetical protein